MQMKSLKNFEKYSKHGYISEFGRPLNIAHRGLCSLLPQNTLQAFEAALYQGADFIEFDVVLTKDRKLLVCHDPFLSRLTNIEDNADIIQKKEKRIYEGEIKNDWWIDQFDLQEMKNFGVRQNLIPGRPLIYDEKLSFPTLEEVIELVINFNKQHKGSRNPDSRNAGMFIESKDGKYYREKWGKQIGEYILEVLKKHDLQTMEKCSEHFCPIFLQSFDYETVKYWSVNSELPRNYLVDEKTHYDLNQVSHKATGIGFSDKVIWDYKLKTATKQVRKAKQEGLLVFAWTFRDDSKLFFNAKDNMDAYRIAQNQLQLDGIITEFSDVYATLAQILRKQREDKIYQLQKIHPKSDLPD